MVRYNSEDINWNEIRARINDQDNKLKTSAHNDIDWEELRRKVEDDSDDEYYCSDCNQCANQKDCIGLPTKDESDTYDFADEHGLLDENGEMMEIDDEYNNYINNKDDVNVSAIAWNTKTKPVEGGDFLGLQKPNMFYPKSDFDYTGVNKLVIKQDKKEPKKNIFSKMVDFLADDEDEKKKLEKENDIQCSHFIGESEGVGEVYIYPINDNTRICLCKTCNANLASKMLEQLALETFI